LFIEGCTPHYHYFIIIIFCQRQRQRQRIVNAANHFTAFGLKAGIVTDYYITTLG
jgi:hypothetical protein